MAMAAAAGLLCSVAILPNSADADERSEWLVIFVFVGVFCAALAVRSFYRGRKENLDLFLFIFDGRGKTCGFIGENAQKFLIREPLAK
jgi:hypothetical protein